MQGFTLRYFAGYWFGEGETAEWVPALGSRAGKWFFYTWDGEQRTFVEIGEVGESELEQYLPPVAPAEQTAGETNENPETEIEPETTEQQNREMPKQENAETQNPETPEQENAGVQKLEVAKQENKKSSFPVLPFAITGGAVLVAGIAVLRKRRKGKAIKP